MGLVLKVSIFEVNSPDNTELFAQNIKGTQHLAAELFDQIFKTLSLYKTKNIDLNVALQNKKKFIY